jgi:hypothetical protein
MPVVSYDGTLQQAMQTFHAVSERRACDTCGFTKPEVSQIYTAMTCRVVVNINDADPQARKSMYCEASDCPCGAPFNMLELLPTHKLFHHQQLVTVLLDGPEPRRAVTVSLAGEHLIGVQLGARYAI